MAGIPWTEKEIAILEEKYAVNASMDEMMKALPRRTKASIICKASSLSLGDAVIGAFKRSEALKKRYKNPKFAKRVGFQKGSENVMADPEIVKKMLNSEGYKNRPSRKGQKQPTTCGNRNPSKRLEVRKKISLKLRKLAEENDERIMKGLRKGWNTHPASKPKYPDSNGNILRSRYELKVTKALKELGLDYVYEPMICGYYPDFQLIIDGILTNKLIEFDGGLRDRQVMIKKTQVYKENGYDLLILDYKTSSVVKMKEEIQNWLEVKD